MIGLDKIAQIVTTKEVLIAFIVVSGIAAMEAGIIGGLVTRVGGFRKLWELTSSITTKKCSKDTCDK